MCFTHIFIETVCLYSYSNTILINTFFCSSNCDKHYLQLHYLFFSMPQYVFEVCFPLGATKSIFKPMVRSLQTMPDLAPRLTLYPNESKQASTWPMSPKSSMGCDHIDFWACGTFGANHAQSCTEINTIRGQQPVSKVHILLCRWMLGGTKPKTGLPLQKL